MSQPQSQSRPDQIQQSINQARKFHEYDRQLDAETRKRMVAAFKSEHFWLPVGALGGLMLGIMAPRIAAKRGLIKVKVTQTRMWSALLGLPGFMIGGRIGSETSLGYHQNKLNDSPAACQILEITKRWPPQIGEYYFENTSRDPSLIMRDPDTMDWSKSPLFPMNLVQDAIRHRQQQAQRGRTPSSAPQSEQSDAYFDQPREGFSKDGENISWDSYSGGSSDQDYSGSGTKTTSGNSWDRIRQSRQQQQQTKQNQQNQQTEQDSDDWTQSSTSNMDRPGSLTPTPPPPALSGPPQTQARMGSWEANDQAEFDRELERERQGYGVKDDFSDTEKKW